MEKEQLFQLLSAAELVIQKIMLDLDEKLAEEGYRVATVSVDTRNFANMATEIFVTWEGK